MPHPPILLEAESLEREGKHAEALRLYDRILAQNEEHPILMAAAACPMMHDRERIGTAIVLFRSALRLCKEQGIKVPVELMSNLGLAYKFSGQREKALEWLKRACDTNPDHASAWTNYGCMFGETDTPEKGRECLERAVKLDPSLPMAHWNLALCLMATAHRDDNWRQAWIEHEWGQIDGGMRIKKKLVNLPDWDGTPGKKVLMYGEQGLGDEIMFASMVPDAMKDCREVILDCHPRLTTLFSKAFGVKCYGTRKIPTLDWIAEENPDAMIALGSLGQFYRNNKSDFTGAPYLKAEPLPKGDKFRVGISWTGGRLTQRVARRTVPLNWWRSILDVRGIEFVSLQYTDGAADEIESVNRLGYDIKQAPEARAEDYYECARLVASCDLVISVCTSVIHLAGALGVPTWVLVPKHPAWRYQASGVMPWYRSVRLYRQPEDDTGAWLPVVQRIGLDLSDLAEQKERKAA